jgi:hypothetical protein
MSTRRVTRYLLFCLVLLAPAPALANMGTPLMWASAFYLLVGNAIIGVLEGLLISKVFRVPKLRAIALLIAGNYVSAWVGAFSLDLRDPVMFAVFGERLLYNLEWALAASLACAFVLTILLEWPFIAAVLRDQPRFGTRALKASCMVQVASYALLVPGFDRARSG